MLIPFGRGTRMTSLNARSSTPKSMSLLWMRISNRSNDAFPSPQGLSRVVIFNRFVGREIGPLILVLVLLAMSTMLFRTWFSASTSVLASFIRAFCMIGGYCWAGF